RTRGRTETRGGEAVSFEIVNPESLGAPKGWSNGVLAPAHGRLLFVAGQAGWPRGASGAPDGFVAQFARALDQVLEVVRSAGGAPTDVARLTVYVTDLAAYRASLGALGEAWRAHFEQRHGREAAREPDRDVV